MAVSKILVTGASGFVGGRVTHRIALGEEFAVKAMVHRVSGPGTMRLGRLPIEIESGSVLDDDRLEALLSDCDAVINCAHGGPETVVEGTRTLLSAAENQGAEAYIHMSSAAVHGHGTPGRITERTPLAPDTEYARVKADAEEVATGWTGSLEPTIFRPFIIYGPHSPWVRKPIQHLQQGIVLTNGGVGEVNQIYIDNLIDALLAAVSTPEAAGEVFLAADDDRVTWREYYTQLGEKVGHPHSGRSMSERRLQLESAKRTLVQSIVPPIRLIGGLATAPETMQRAAVELRQTPWAPVLFRTLPEPVQDQITSRVEIEPGPAHDGAPSLPAKEYLPEPSLRKMHATRNRVSNRKMKDVLGWEQRVSFEEGLELATAWAEYEELIPTDERAEIFA